MEAVPPLARAYVTCVALAALSCLLPLPGMPVPWWAVLALAAVAAACDGLVRRHSAGPFYPVLLAAAFLLPPPAAALVPLPG
ncbi:metal-dependent phosphohydrolase, partial [Streptomyces sp. SID625]|nr:metal-dependent phosphohydrolase [Streptomyces sp. SID625]